MIGKTKTKMTKNLHLEHPEDTVLTGDLSVLDWFTAGGNLSVKMDGSPAIVWGTDPSTGDFFVGTKSVFNKKKIKICYTEVDVFALYGEQPILVEILCACLKYLPRGEFIYQGDFIGFGGSQEYTPNTITYKFPEVVRHMIIIAPHTEYVTSGELKDSQVVGPIDYQINGNDQVLFVQPRSYIVHNQDKFYDVEEICNFARQISTICNFISDKQLTEMKKSINACICEQKSIEDDAFDCDPNLIRLWKLVKSIKEDCLFLCRNNGPEAYIQSKQIDA
jgi:hypothetical protein